MDEVVLNEVKTAVDDLVATAGTRFDEIGAALKKVADRQDLIETRFKRVGITDPNAPANEAVALERKALADFARRGQAMQTLSDFIAQSPEFKAMSVGSDPEGGYTVTPFMSSEIMSVIHESSPIRAVARVVTITTDRFEEIEDRGDDLDCAWVSETQGRPATATPALGKLVISPGEIYAFPQATQRLLDDSGFSIENWLMTKIGEKMARKESTAFVNGDGIGKPTGFMTLPVAATADATRAWGTLEYLATGTSAGFGTDPAGAEKLIDFVHKMKTAYRTDAVWCMNKKTIGTVRKLRDAAGRFIWQDSLAAGQPDRLLGYRVVEAEDMPDIAANSFSIAFGNFRRGYVIVDRQGVRILRDPFTNKPYVGFYTTRRVGGNVQNSESIKLLKFGTS